MIKLKPCPFCGEKIKVTIGFGGLRFFKCDCRGADVNKYKYEINYLPKTIQPFTITSND